MIVAVSKLLSRSQISRVTAAILDLILVVYSHHTDWLINFMEKVSREE